MAKEVLKQFGNLVIKMDTGATDSYDAKRPHVSFVVNGIERFAHIYLDEVQSSYCQLLEDCNGTRNKGEAVGTVTANIVQLEFISGGEEKADGVWSKAERSCPMGS